MAVVTAEEPPALDVTSAGLISSHTFMDLFNRSLAPELPMFLLRQNEKLAVYVGLWNTWWVNDSNRAAKVVYVTVLKDPGVPAPPGPLPLRDLSPWLVVQLHHIDEDSPAWEATRRALASKFEPVTSSNGDDVHQPVSRPRVDNKPRCNNASSSSSRLVFDPTENNHTGQVVAEPAQLTTFHVEQVVAPAPDAPPVSGLPRPAPLLDRRRVEYTITGVGSVRVFVEKPASKHVLQHHLDADSGLTRTGTLLGAINEWHTWIVADSL